MASISYTKGGGGSLALLSGGGVLLAAGTGLDGDVGITPFTAHCQEGGVETGTRQAEWRRTMSSLLPLAVVFFTLAPAHDEDGTTDSRLPLLRRRRRYSMASGPT